MADNVQLTAGALYVATRESDGIQHQKMVPEFLHGGVPVAVGPTAPAPSVDDANNLLLTQILIELRAQSEMMYSQTNLAVEPLELLRVKYKEYPIVP